MITRKVSIRDVTNTEATPHSSLRYCFYYLRWRAKRLFLRLPHTPIFAGRLLWRLQ